MADEGVIAVKISHEGLEVKIRDEDGFSFQKLTRAGWNKVLEVLPTGKTFIECEVRDGALVIWLD